MYLLIVKDGLLTRYVGPYSSTKKASDDLQRVLTSCSNRASWQIHALETPAIKSLTPKNHFSNREFQERKAS